MFSVLYPLQPWRAVLTVYVLNVHSVRRRDHMPRPTGTPRLHMGIFIVLSLTPSPRFFYSIPLYL